MSEELTKRMFNTLKCLAEAVNHSIRTHAASLQLAWPADFLPASTNRLFLLIRHDLFWISPPFALTLRYLRTGYALRIEGGFDTSARTGMGNKSCRINSAADLRFPTASVVISLQDAASPISKVSGGLFNQIQNNSDWMASAGWPRRPVR